MDVFMGGTPMPLGQGFLLCGTGVPPVKRNLEDEQTHQTVAPTV